MPGTAQGVTFTTETATVVSVVGLNVQMRASPRNASHVQRLLESWQIGDRQWSGIFWVLEAKLATMAAGPG